MTQHYFNPARESDPHALPDCEVFRVDSWDTDYTDGDDNPLPAGWYWWACFPGCLPHGDPTGPFDTEADAIADAQNFD